MAHRVQRHGASIPRRSSRHPWRRSRSGIPTPRERGSSIRIGHWRGAVRSFLDAQRSFANAAATRRCRNRSATLSRSETPWKSHSTDAIRIWIFQRHYRSPATYDEENLVAAERAVRRLRQAARATNTSEDSVEIYDADHIRQRFVEAMDDDLNTPRALAAVFDLAREIFTQQSAGADISNAQSTLRELVGVLGLTLEEPDSDDAEGEAEIDALIEKRRIARSERDFATADSIRDQLAEMGIEISDTPQGTTWRRA